MVSRSRCNIGYWIEIERSIAEAEVVHHSSTQESTTENTVDDTELQTAHAESSKAVLNGPVATHAEASKAKSDAILAERERFKSRSVNDTYSITECVSVLNEIEDVTDDIYMKALEKFMDPGWREAFLAMPNDRRKAWLVRLKEN
ncbi:F-box protein [Trifolium medium]|uniref:F-box protein n=1 Tax=Trifolium medium TaxID=97028 RepID=A0A392MAG2_9FABA|nr:F-box protein [Trifolium medium]